MRLFHSSSDIPSTIFQVSCLHYKRWKGFCKTPPTPEESPKIPAATVVFCSAHRPRRWRFHCEKMEILRWHSWGIPWIPPFSWHSHINIGPLGDFAWFTVYHRLPFWTKGCRGGLDSRWFESISISYGFSFCFPIVDGSILLWGNVYIHSSQLKTGVKFPSFGSYTQHHISPFPLKSVMIQLISICLLLNPHILDDEIPIRFGYQFISDMAARFRPQICVCWITTCFLLKNHHVAMNSWLDLVGLITIFAG